ncbi:MAG: FAD-dependent oxidoreductase [Anaerolineales bacterium]|nr:FAD-dependent oxidoreductase [Anaerolineales bacterium]
MLYEYENKKSLFAPVKAWRYLTKKALTIPMNKIFDEPREASDRYRGFHINDWEKCIGCGTCSEICPTNAIQLIEIPEIEDKDGSKPERPAIDYGRCSFCGLCVDICASDSLKMTKEYIHISPDANTFNFLPKEDGIHQIEFLRGYDRDETSELLELTRTNMEMVDAKGRKDSFIEIVKGYSKKMAEAEAARCVECGICTKTCPAHMNIPEYIKAVWTGDLSEAVTQVYKTNPLPAVCGRICSHKCETACALGNRGEAIAIRWLKRYIVDNTPDEEYEAAIMASVSQKGEGRVAIIGSGPSGISAAYYLRTLGYEVHVYEEKALPGGVTRYGAPNYRLPEDKIAKDISFLEKIGVQFHVNAKIGRDISLEELRENNDAVFAGSGFFKSRNLPIKGTDHKDIVMSMDLLGASRDFSRKTAEMPEIHEKVVVIGGGNVAFDVARSLVRLQNIKYGKSHVSLAALESEDILPADREEFEEGKEEGLRYYLGNGPQEIIIDEKSNKIKGVRVWKCVSLFDEQKRFSPKFNEKEETLIEGTQVYIAIGQMPDYNYLSEALQSKMEINRGKIKVQENGQVAGIPWLFAGGDIVHGPDIIHGIADGHNAAKGIDEYLMKLKTK